MLRSYNIPATSKLDSRVTFAGGESNIKKSQDFK